MGFLSDLFGGTDDSASRRAARENERTREFIEAQTNLSREQAGRLFPQSIAALRGGQQAGLDVFGALAPQQAQQFQAGNIAAQQTLNAFQPGIEAALLGNPVPQAPTDVFRGTPTDFSGVPTPVN